MPGKTEGLAAKGPVWRKGSKRRRLTVSDRGGGVTSGEENEESPESAQEAVRLPGPGGITMAVSLHSTLSFRGWSLGIAIPPSLTLFRPLRKGGPPFAQAPPFPHQGPREAAGSSWSP